MGMTLIVLGLSVWVTKCITTLVNRNGCIRAYLKSLSIHLVFIVRGLTSATLRSLTDLIGQWWRFDLLEQLHSPTLFFCKPRLGTSWWWLSNSSSTNLASNQHLSVLFGLLKSKLGPTLLHLFQVRDLASYVLKGLNHDKGRLQLRVEHCCLVHI